MFRRLVLDGVYFTTHSSQYNYKHQKLLKTNSCLRIIIIHSKQYGKINEEGCQKTGKALYTNAILTFLKFCHIVKYHSGE
jgi:hypothetical protein